MGAGGGPSGESAKDTNFAVRRLLAYLSPYRLQLVAVAVLVIATTIGQLAGPILLGVAIDRFILPGDVPGLIRIALLMLGVFVPAGVASIGQGLIMVSVGQRPGRRCPRRAVHPRAAAVDGLPRPPSRRRPDEPRHQRHRSDQQALSNGLIDIHHQYPHCWAASWSPCSAQLAVGHWHADPAAADAVDYRRRHHAQPHGFPRCAAQPGRAQRGDGRKHRRHSRGARPLPVRRTRSQSSSAANAANRRAGVKADIITAALGPMFTTMSTITIAATALLGGWLALRGIVRRGRDRHLCGLHYELLPPYARASPCSTTSLQSALAGAERIFEVLDEVPTVADRPDAATPAQDPGRGRRSTM